MGNIVTTKPKSIFKKTHDLEKTRKAIKRTVPAAIKVLEDLLTNEDPKIKLMAAEKLLKYYTDMAKEINQDSLNRLILEIKASGLAGQGSTADDDDDTPELNFNEIHKDFRNDVEDAQNVIDMSEVSKIG